jgi:hypothetical protein
MENREFFIKYLNYQPVGIRTHILNTNTFELIQTIATVGDLIGAYKTAVAPLLDLFSTAQLTLHLPDGSAIPGNILLATIQETVGSYDVPLVIKSVNDARGTLD